METTEIKVEHPTFKAYHYKFKLLGELECQVFKVSGTGKEVCLERGTFSKVQLMYDWINFKVALFDKDLQKKASTKKKPAKEKIDILERGPQFII